MSQSALPKRRFQSIRRAAEANGVSYDTGVNYIKRGKLAAYKLPGRRGHYVDVDEAAKVLGQRQQYGTFGPDAKVRDLSSVVADFEVLD